MPWEGSSCLHLVSIPYQNDGALDCGLGTRLVFTCSQGRGVKGWKNLLCPQNSLSPAYLELLGARLCRRRLVRSATSRYLYWSCSHSRSSSEGGPGIGRNRPTSVHETFHVTSRLWPGACARRRRPSRTITCDARDVIWRALVFVEAETSALAIL